MWLGLLKHLNYNILLKLLKLFENIEELYLCTNSTNNLYNRLKHNNVYITHELFIELTDKNIKNKANKIYNIFKFKNVYILGIFSKFYPGNLLNLFSPPLVIFVSGNINYLSNTKIYIENMLEFSEYGERFTKSLLKYLEHNKYSLVFYNTTVQYKKLKDIYKINSIICIDVICVEELENIRLSKDINECQVIVIYNKDNTNNNVQKNPISNVINREMVAAIADMLLVIEADLDENNVKLVDIFLELGRDIYALPGSIYSKKSRLSNFAIKNGAYMLTSKNDIIGIKT